MQMKMAGLHTCVHPNDLHVKHTLSSIRHHCAALEIERTMRSESTAGLAVGRTAELPDRDGQTHAQALAVLPRFAIVSRSSNGSALCRRWWMNQRFERGLSESHDDVQDISGSPLGCRSAGLRLATWSVWAIVPQRSAVSKNNCWTAPLSRPITRKLRSCCRSLMNLAGRSPKRVFDGPPNTSKRWRIDQERFRQAT